MSSGFDFYKRAAIVCAEIPCGKVATYGQIALLCGRPENSRQVGYALNRGLLGCVPAHRVVNSRGILSGAAAFDTYDMQRLLLEGEGVETGYTKDGWKTDLKQYRWENTMEDALIFRKKFEQMGI